MYLRICFQLTDDYISSMSLPAIRWLQSRN